jgi:hypothetical protein
MPVTELEIEAEQLTQFLRGRNVKMIWRHQNRDLGEAVGTARNAPLPTRAINCSLRS